MKLIALFLFFTVLPINWEPDFNNAKKKAKEKNELILLNFSGSDWCGPCIVLRRDYLESSVFSDMADKNLILVNADFPRKKKNIGTPEQVKRNEDLAERYNKEGSFPLTLLLDADGKVIKTWNGKPETSPEEWTAEIKAICDSRK
ncbi:thioredoxin family protein [Flavobacterium sp. Fl-77]|uniref:Thioredoxin family protein n=1 Tax=Flavobacterium flavipigmentatum TaxID=2893884 RepID=A0AAJ2SFY4_9FLAO|nr:MULTISPECIES: thioredoxin family protein [unclassified Flavobacterium]MDX6182528.1 thioredoxin family protein [Flavobacterium sp. Fl-33]MDX6185559.1 thioredoxin family protein [Flavobacterium sp. Fl-77]UFH38748.1 thioredoxin family protein [Flavobacterium sp. F-70]